MVTILVGLALRYYLALFSPISEGHLPRVIILAEVQVEESGKQS
jgi:hypothetical protein